MASPQGPEWAGGRTDDRRTWMDLLRGVTVIAVVLGHVSATASPQSPGLFRALLAGSWFLSPFRLPLLMVLSGLLLHRALAKDTATYALGKVRHLAWPWALWTGIIALYALDGTQPRTVRFGLEYAISGTTTWYLAALLFCFALAPGLTWAPSPVVAAALATAARLVHENHPGPATILWYAAFFFVGDALARVIEHWLATPWPVPVAAALIAVGWGWRAMDRAEAPLWEPWYLLPDLAGVLVAVWGAARIPRVTAVRWLETVGRHSIIPYVVHVPASALAAHLLARGGLAGTRLELPLILVAALGSATLAVRYRDRFRWLFTMPWPQRWGRPVRDGAAGPAAVSRPTERPSDRLPVDRPPVDRQPE